MHRDTKIGLALGVLLLGVVAAFYFRNDNSSGFSLPKLENPAKYFSRIAEKPVGPYLTGVEAADPAKKAGNAPGQIPHLGAPVQSLAQAQLRPNAPEPAAPTPQLGPGPPRPAAPAPAQPVANAPAKQKPEEPSPWQLPAFLKDARNKQNADPLAQSRVAPDPIPSDRRAWPAPEHNKAWTVAEAAVKSPSDRVIEQNGRVHTVTSGDTLSGLAARYLGSSSRYHEIYAANRDVLNSPDELKVGMQLRIPSADGSPIARKSNGGIKAKNASIERRTPLEEFRDDNGKPGSYRSQPPASGPRRFVPVNSPSPFTPRFEEKRPMRIRRGSTDANRTLSQAPPTELPAFELD